MKKILTRTATGAAFVAVLIGSILYGKASFGALFMLVTLLAVSEFCKLTKSYKQTTFSIWLAVLGGGYLFIATFMVFLGVANAPLTLYTPYFAIVAYAFIKQLFDTESKPLDNYAYFVLSQVYVALPFALLNILATAGSYRIVLKATRANSVSRTGYTGDIPPSSITGRTIPDSRYACRI